MKRLRVVWRLPVAAWAPVARVARLALAARVVPAVRTAVPQSPRRRAAVREMLGAARRSFVQVQAAWDRADLEALRPVTTEALLDELRTQLALRAPGVHHTEVVALRARLLALEELREGQIASVEFSGLIRERRGARPAPFRELWLLADEKAAGRGWRLARVQALL
jgi:predicted lipid-binding transport protein (Tim44 family)